MGDIGINMGQGEVCSVNWFEKGFFKVVTHSGIINGDTEEEPTLLKV